MKTCDISFVSFAENCYQLFLLSVQDGRGRGDRAVGRNYLLAC